MLFAEIYQDIISSFGSLWKYKERGKSLEIITPFATTTQRFVSIFLTEKEGSFIVSDGGWLDANVYENTFNSDEEVFRRIILHYQSSFDIKEVKDANEKKFYYKKTNSPIAVPSLIYDMANFISTLISLGEVEFLDKVEKETKERFRKMANEYLQSFIPKDNLDLQGYLDEKKSLRFNAIVKHSSSKITLVNYVTGSTPSHFTNSVSKTNLMFEMADKSLYKDHVSRKVSVIDNVAGGYQPESISSIIDYVIENTRSERVNWSERERLKNIL